MHKCNRSPCAVWVENCELFSGGNIRELNINEQLSESRVDAEHRRQQTLPSSVSAYFIYFIFYQPSGLSLFCE